MANWCTKRKMEIINNEDQLCAILSPASYFHAFVRWFLRQPISSTMGKRKKPMWNLVKDRAQGKSLSTGETFSIETFRIVLTVPLYLFVFKGVATSTSTHQAAIPNWICQECIRWAFQIVKAQAKARITAIWALTYSTIYYCSKVSPTVN